jgi:hypothetical protein
MGGVVILGDHTFLTYPVSFGVIACEADILALTGADADPFAVLLTVL